MDLSPISAMIEVTGEDALISSPTVAASGDYNPTSPTDSTSAPPVIVPVRLMIATRDMVKQGLMQGVDAAVTIEATSKPAGMTAGQSQLIWNGTTYTIARWRERRYLGELDGYTLFLVA